MAILSILELSALLSRSDNYDSPPLTNHQITIKPAMAANLISRSVRSHEKYCEGIFFDCSKLQLAHLFFLAIIFQFAVIVCRT